MLQFHIRFLQLNILHSHIASYCIHSFWGAPQVPLGLSQRSLMHGPLHLETCHAVYQSCPES